MTMPPEVDALIERFMARRHEYMSPSYMEARVRIDFLNPFFSALGWDVANLGGHSEHEREVITEDRIKTSAGLKFPDYMFQFEGRQVFPVEAKKPSVNLKVDSAPALQLRRYAWNSAQVGVGILTDFQELAVYDCRIAPEGSDPATKALIDYYTVEEYRDRWDEIEDRFSRQAVASGSLDEYVATFKGARGKQRVDKLFLSSLEEWRKELAMDLAKRNRLSQEDINTAVQLIIDRIVFLRVAEDRGLERYGDLKGASGHLHAYQSLQNLFEKADQKYNSGLFHFSDERGTSSKDDLTPGLDVSNNVLAPFIQSLYWPQGPYDFQVFPTDVLGQVYEQFLGKVIHLESPRHATVEDKPEVRKSKGVFYTPTKIVRQIVRAALEPLLTVASPQSLEKNGLFICDPSCGSGSFLIEVYQQLLDWHLHYFTTNNPSRWSKGRHARIHKPVGGVWRLTPVERKRILLRHVYGVDIDPQAVEVTKLALLLKVLEGETESSLYEQTALFHERVLPDLGTNIKCGNSLIGNAIHFTTQSALSGDFERRVNAFDWDLEFPNVTARRGFDVIVGNPPWLMAGYYVAESTEYLRKHFSTATGKFDLYYLFIEQCLRLLTPGGYFGLIVPNKMFHTRAAKALRQLLATRADLSTIQDFGTEKLFEGATNYSCIMVGRNQAPNPEVIFQRATADLSVWEEFSMDQKLLSSAPWNFMDEAARDLWERLTKETDRLEDLVDRFGTGAQTGSDKLLTFDGPTAREAEFEKRLIVPLLRGRDVRAYSLNNRPKCMLFPYLASGENFTILTERELRTYPRTYAYLKANREALSKRVWFKKTPTELSGAWYGYMYVEQRKYLARPHLLTPALSPVSNFALGNGALFATGTAGVTSLVLRDAGYSPEFLLGILNSSVAGAWVRSHSPIFQGGYRKFSAPYLKDIPVPKLDMGTAKDRRRHDQLVNSVKQVLLSLEKLKEATASGDKDRLERQVEAAKRAVDDAVHNLYGLSPVESEWVRRKSGVK